MQSRRPYLIRALYSWLLDNNELPHLLVETSGEQVIVPKQFINDGRIVLNISPEAVQMLELGNDMISFNARFQGSPMNVSFPPDAVIAIYGRDSGQGMLFGDDVIIHADESAASAVRKDRPDPPQKGKPTRPTLKVIK